MIKNGLVVLLLLFSTICVRAAESRWNYFNNNDEMREETSYFAALRSSNTIHSKQFGMVYLTIYFMAKPSSKYSNIPNITAFFVLSDGLIDCEPAPDHDCSVSYRVDKKAVDDSLGFVLEGKPDTLYLGHGSLIGHNGNRAFYSAIFLSGLAWFSQFRMAKQVIVEVPVVGHGLAQFKFHVSDLKPLEDYRNWVR